MTIYKSVNNHTQSANIFAVNILQERYITCVQTQFLTRVDTGLISADVQPKIGETCLGFYWHYAQVTNKQIQITIIANLFAIRKDICGYPHITIHV